MRRTHGGGVVFLALFFSLAVGRPEPGERLSTSAAEGDGRESGEGLPGIETRVPWTTSRIAGTPEPPSPYRAERVFPRLEFRQPVDLALFPGTDKLCVVERTGTIRIFDADPVVDRSELMFDGAEAVDGLQAIYGLAFHPNFKKNRYCYICYILADGLPDGTHVSRFRVAPTDPPHVVPESERVLLTWRSGGHNGGCLKFGPDGYLYISVGDGAPPSPPDPHDSGQDIGDFLGSILRIDVDRDEDENGKAYGIPPDNPFVEFEGARPEVWAYGLRNPWRMSFDRTSGDLWLGDVGWQLWEMVHRIEPGGNYGWSIVEGPQPVRPEARRGPTPILPAIFSHPRAEAASVTGGYVYRGKKLLDLSGEYVYGDYVTGKIWALRRDGGQVVRHRELADTTIAIIAFYEDPAGELLFMDYNAGTFHRLVPNIREKQTREFPRKLSETGIFSSVSAHRPAPGVVPFSVNAEPWNDGATAERFVAVPGKGRIELARPDERVPLAWGSFPPNTVLVKTIFLELEVGNSESRRRVETQVLHFQGDSWRGNTGEWLGYTYTWNEEETDATLAPAEGQYLRFSILDPDATGGRRQQTWRVPSRSECYVCHNPWAGYRLGFTPEQLDREHDYGGRSASQLGTLEHIGLLGFSTRKKAGKSKRENSLPAGRLVDPYDELEDLNARARSYLHANCAHCHRFGGGGTATIDLRLQVPLEKTRTVGVLPTQGAFGLPGAQIIAPGDPYRSTLFYRVTKLGAGRMPYMGSERVDRKGIGLLERWIADLPGKPLPMAGPLTQRSRPQHSRDIAALRLLESPGGSLPEARRRAMDQLLASTEGALRLVRALDKGVLDPGIAQQVVGQTMEHLPDPVRDLFERFVPEEERRRQPGDLLQPEAVLSRPGDSRNGSRLFFELETTRCSSCHRIKTVGGNMGPDLSHIGKKYSRRQILESILEPSKVMDPEFVPHSVVTTDGRVISGFLEERTADRVVLRDIQEERHIVPTGDISLIQPQTVSLMPKLLYRDLSLQDLADVVEFLASLE